MLAALHGLERRGAAGEVGDARVGVGRGAGRVELDGVDVAAGFGALDLGRAGAIGQIERHQRLKRRIGRPRAEDALAIGERVARWSSPAARGSA
jgi:hypothetical protein